MMGNFKSYLLVLGASLLVLFSLGQSNIKSRVIEASEDTYIVTDLADTENLQGFSTNNYGSLEFLKTWYAFEVAGQERILSVDLVKFNIKELEGVEVESAFLQLFASRADLTELARLIDVHLIRENTWSEATVSYDTRPPWNPTPISTAVVYGAGGWYSWNVSSSVASAARTGQVSFAVGIRNLPANSEAQVAFVSRASKDKAPR